MPRRRNSERCSVVSLGRFTAGFGHEKSLSLFKIRPFETLYCPSTMYRTLSVAMLILCVGSLCAQEPLSGIDAAAAMEKALVDVIARTEKSVVAIARVRRETAGRDVPARTRGPTRSDAGRRRWRRRSRPIPTSSPTNTAPAWWSIAAA